MFLVFFFFWFLALLLFTWVQPLPNSGLLKHRNRYGLFRYLVLTTWDVDVITDVLRFNHWKRTTSHDNFCRLKSFSCGCITQGSYGYICDNKLIIIKRIYQKEIDNLTVFRILDSILFSLCQSCHKHNSRPTFLFICRRH